jgi:folylpolyglutamate synthase
MADKLMDAESSCSSTDIFETAVAALYSSAHQSSTPTDIRAAAARRTVTCRDMRTYLQRLGFSNGQYDGITKFRRLVHITGTKGKGSTACLAEGILRNAYGLRTGMFTSPHLMDIRERIRVNGKPVSKAVFGEVYWDLRRRLEDPENSSCDEQDELQVLPGYFRMLTLMVSYRGFPSIYHLVVGKTRPVSSPGPLARTTSH